MAETVETGKRGLGRLRIPLQIQRISWRDFAVSIGPVLLVIAAAVWIAFHFVRPAPPNEIIIMSGPEGSSFRTYAERYGKILARNGVHVKILPSEGSLDNLKRLADPNFAVDIGFVQGGESEGIDISQLVSLGSIAYSPVLIFYRSHAPVTRLSDFKGRRIAIGQVGSGTHVLGLALLKANDIEPKALTRLSDLSGEAAVDALLRHKIDATILMGDSATPANMRKLLHAHGIRLFDFVQGDGYVRRFRYLTKLELPVGSLDLGKNFPAKPLTMIAPTLEIVAHGDLHPALSDLLIEAAREVHGRASLLQHAGEFPAPLEHEYPISDDAARYYKSGKTFAYRHLPFWLASLADRALVVLVPVIVLLVPGLRIVPMIYSWRIRTRIFRRYGELMALERVALEPATPEQRAVLLKQLDDIEKAVVTTKMPGSFADQLYVLRQHIKFVQDTLKAGGAAT